MTKQHHWAYCKDCRHRMVVCGKCGNNCCNGGYGEIGGVQCDACPEAYAMQDAGESEAWRVRDEWEEYRNKPRDKRIAGRVTRPLMDSDSKDLLFRADLMLLIEEEICRWDDSDPPRHALSVVWGKIRDMQKRVASS